MNKTLLLASLFLAGTLAFGQCLPPVVNGTPVSIGPGSAPDYFGCANYASSPLPKRSCSYADPVTYPLGKACYGDLECANEIDPANPTVVSTCSGPLVPGTGIHKFVDTLPGLTPAGRNNLGQYIPVAVPDTVTYPGSDYYEIALVEYSEKMHTDLPPTKLRGYIQLNYGTDAANCPSTGCTAANNTIAPDPNPHYLGPTILAQRDRPVRILFRNQLPTGQGGNLFVPVDTTIMGSGVGPDAGGTMPTDTGSTTDAVRNPVCGTTPKPPECFTENRATLHLHGGITPWISDGTPHQWITPANEPAPYPDSTLQPRRNQGVSVVNVPDMPDPGPGAQTFFYTNQQSARLMFYHDHAWGITRLNVYAGEAAGYVLTDQAEQALMAPGGALDGLGYGIPLIIQDRTFIPTPDQLATEDPTWDSARWGGWGSVWVPHVYMPAQNPNDPTGMSGFGRWMYGPWFWPPATPPYGPIANPYFDPTCDPDIAGWCQPPLIPGTPNLSVGMEHFNDTPIVNGTAYPKLTLAPGEYRFRILNAANDRFWNLQWYVADSTGTEVALNAAEVAAAQLDPNIFPTPDTVASPPGPAWVQIGTEGGFLPSPVVVPNQVTTWVIDPTRFDVGNVDKHSLLLAPAERADVVVDLTPFAGKTLILYNDAPAAFPARVGTYDYYTGAPDQTDAGGAPSILPGFGPNTRTIMQVVVTGSGGAPTPNHVNPARLASLQAAFAHQLDQNGNPAGVFESSQDPIIVGQATYNQAYGSAFRTSAPRNGVARISDFSMTFNTLLTGNSSTNVLTIPFQPKALHDEMNAVAFDDYGRMTANIGLEAPNPTPGGQNVILYPYINPPIRSMAGFPTGEDINGIELPPGTLQVTPIASADDGTQIWRITHNGVDTHPIHFHMFNVQLLNRVAWDNRVLMPDANELGWKDTVRMSPLQDTIVALRPIVPKIPFGVPDSHRPLNPAMPLGNANGFNATDPNGNPIPGGISNQLADFGWEYVWHCHILGHEEMDMMRPLIANVSRALPAAPVVSATWPGAIVLTWTDGTPADYFNPANWGNPANEIGFHVERADVVNNTAGPYATVGSALANQTTFSDSAVNATSVYSYRVVAFNAAGESPSQPVTVTPVVPIAGLAPNLSFGNQLVTTTSAPQSVTLSNTGTGPLTISGIAVTGADLTNFALAVSTNPCGTSLAAGTNCTIDVTFTPDAARPFGASVTVTSNDPVNPSLSVSLSGTGVTAALTITADNASRPYGSANPAFTATYAGFVGGDTPSSLNGSLQCTTPATQSSPVGAYAITCSGQFSPKYTITYVDGTLSVTAVPLTITANNKTRAFNTPNPAFDATYTGFVNGDTPASLTGGLACTTTATQTSPPGTYPINCAGQTSTNYAITYVAGTLTITGTGPVLSLSPPALSFASTPNVASAPQAVTVSNTGSAPLMINSITLGGANPGRFSQTNNCPIGGAGLGVGLSCTVNVRFTPNNNPVTRTATLNVNVAAPAASGSVALTGNTIRPTVTVLPTAINFGNQPINTTSAPQTVTVTSTGTVPLIISSITIGGANPNRFAQTNNCPIGGAGLAPGASCQISVTFTPNRRVARSATLIIRDNAANSPQTVALSGTGI